MQVKILKYDDLGNGLLKINDKVCFVKKALPGEVVNIKIDSSKKSYLEASIVNILEEMRFMLFAYPHIDAVKSKDINVFFIARNFYFYRCKIRNKLKSKKWRKILLDVIFYDWRIIS